MSTLVTVVYYQVCRGSVDGNTYDRVCSKPDTYNVNIYNIVMTVYDTVIW